MTRGMLWAARVARGTVLFLLGLGVAVLAAALLLAWHLAQGPVDLGWAMPRIQAALDRSGGPMRASVQGATLSWPGFTAGPSRDVELGLAGVRLVDPGRAAPVMQAATVTVTLAPAGLLTLQALPRTLEASGVAVHLQRAPDGLVTLDLADPPPAPDADGEPAPDLVQAMRELTRPPRAAGAGPIRSDLQGLQKLARIRLRDSTVTLHDLGMGGFWQLDVDSLGLERQAQGGVLGQAEATLAVGASRARLAMHAALAPNGGTSLQLSLAPVGTAALQRAVVAQGAQLGEANVLETTVRGSASLLLDASLLPQAGSVQLSAGSGRVRVSGTQIGFESVSLDADASWAVPGWGRPSTVVLSRLKAVLPAPGGGWPSTFTAQGEVVRAGERLTGKASAQLDHLTFTDLIRIWPAQLGGHVRPWLVKSVTAGTARNGQVAAAFTASSALTEVVLTAIDGSVAGDDVTIQWLPPVAPVEHAQALLTIRSPEVLDITMTSARQGGVALSNGAVRITGLNVKDQFLTLNADAAGTVAEMIQFLRLPRLQLLSRKPIPMRNPGGTFAGHLTVFLPLNDDLTFDDVKIGARARTTELRLGGLVAGRDLDHGDVVVEASSEFLKASGKATISGIPAELQVDMDFRNGGPAQVVQRAQATTRTGPRQLAAAGLDTAGIIEAGSGVFTARYAQRRDGAAELAVGADLRDAALGLPGWSKPAGQPATASARLLLRGDQVQGVDQLRAEGPGLSITGRADMVGDLPLLLRLDRVSLGGTQGSGEIQLPARDGEAIRARLQGAVLDLTTVLARKPGKPDTAKDPAWIADVRFDRVMLAPGRFLSGVTAHAENAGGRITALRAVSTGPERLDATIARAGANRTVLVRAADGGGLLRALDLVDTIQGGAMTLRGTYDDSRAEPPLRGTLTLDDFRVRNAPGLGKLLQAVTVYGVFEALSGPGLSFSRLSMPFGWDGTVLDVTDVEAFSTSLGLTAHGRLDTERKLVDVQGTVVPLYMLNSMLGRIPVLGKLFSAEKGGGLLAVNYGLRGPMANPSVSVNPLSALTPGFLRGLFKLLN